MTNIIEAAAEHFKLHAVLDSTQTWVEWAADGLIAHLAEHRDGTLLTFTNHGTGDVYAVKVVQIGGVADVAGAGQTFVEGEPAVNVPPDAGGAPAPVDVTASHANVPAIPGESPVA